jgi:hypothetical protein
MKGLTLFKRMNCNGTPTDSYTLIAWHHPDSITWRFGINYSKRESGKTGVYFMRVYRGQGFNFHVGINLPYVGSLSIQTQPHMWETS